MLKHFVILILMLLQLEARTIFAENTTEVDAPKQTIPIYLPQIAANSDTTSEFLQSLWNNTWNALHKHWFGTYERPVRLSENKFWSGSTCGERNITLLLKDYLTSKTGESPSIVSLVEAHDRFAYIIHYGLIMFGEPATQQLLGFDHRPYWNDLANIDPTRLFINNLVNVDWFSASDIEAIKDIYGSNVRDLAATLCVDETMWDSLAVYSCDCVSLAPAYLQPSIIGADLLTPGVSWFGRFAWRQAIKLTGPRITTLVTKRIESTLVTEAITHDVDDAVTAFSRVQRNRYLFRRPSNPAHLLAPVDEALALIPSSIVEEPLFGRNAPLSKWIGNAGGNLLPESLVEILIKNEYESNLRRFFIFLRSHLTYIDYPTFHRALQENFIEYFMQVDTSHRIIFLDLRDKTGTRKSNDWVKTLLEDRWATIDPDMFNEVVKFNEMSSSEFMTNLTKLINNPPPGYDPSTPIRFVYLDDAVYSGTQAASSAHIFGRMLNIIKPALKSSKFFFDVVAPWSTEAAKDRVNFGVVNAEVFSNANGKIIFNLNRLKTVKEIIEQFAEPEDVPKWVELIQGGSKLIDIDGIMVDPSRLFSVGSAETTLAGFAHKAADSTSVLTLKGSGDKTFYMYFLKDELAVPPPYQLIPNAAAAQTETIRQSFYIDDFPESYTIPEELVDADARASFNSEMLAITNKFKEFMQPGPDGRVIEMMH